MVSQWEPGNAQLEVLMEKMAMPSPAVVRRRIVPSMVLDCIWDGWGGGQPVRLGVMVLLPCCTGCRMDSFCSPSTIPQLKHLVTGRFMNLTHILFAVKED